MAKRYQLQLVQRDADACSVAFIVALWKKLRRPSGDLKALDKLGIDLATSSAAIDLAPPPVDLVLPEDFKDLDKMGSPSPLSFAHRSCRQGCLGAHEGPQSTGRGYGRLHHGSRRRRLQ